LVDITTLNFDIRSSVSERKHRGRHNNLFMFSFYVFRERKSKDNLKVTHTADAKCRQKEPAYAVKTIKNLWAP
jgi:hypothetical protein